MQIVQYPDPFLSEPSFPIFKTETEVFTTLQQMVKFVKENDNAVGLSLVQVGINKRGFVMMVSDKSAEIVINPVIVKRSNETTVSTEGCLSVQGESVPVVRYKWVDVLYYDSRYKVRKARLSGFVARIFQHELDHLNGITIMDRKQEIA